MWTEVMKMSKKDIKRNLDFTDEQSRKQEK